MTRVVIACTWWGHSTATVELGSTRVVTDPLLTDRLFHLVRRGPTPGPEATRADVVLVSHLHQDHCHLPSLRRFGSEVPLVVPRGAEHLLRGLAGDRLVPVEPGDVVTVAGLRIEALFASHDGRRHPLSRTDPPALGFRFASDAGSCWYPGDTELRDDLADIDPVDLALVPVGGWGPTLGSGHLDPAQAAEAARRVGARRAVPVHWGTFWPLALDRVARANHHRLFVTPGARFADALAGSGTQAVVLAPGDRFVAPDNG